MYRKLVSLVRDAQQKYKEMISIYQHEISENNKEQGKAPSKGKRFHMSHSRNPSAASCKSLQSFISEPISELNDNSNWRKLMEQINNEEDLHDNQQDHLHGDQVQDEECMTIVEEEEGDVTSQKVDDVTPSMTSQSAKIEEIVVMGAQKKSDVINSWLQSSADN